MGALLMLKPGAPWLVPPQTAPTVSLSRSVGCWAVLALMAVGTWACVLCLLSVSCPLFWGSWVPTFLKGKRGALVFLSLFWSFLGNS